MLKSGHMQCPNPLGPPGVYIADPEVHQWPDGRMYLYGSRDDHFHRYCSRSYDMLWTSDLEHWHHESETFSTQGLAGADANQLYAPDACHRNGRYYLFYCLSNGSEGVAVADDPLGPFSDGKPISDLDQIDPAVFIDDDGQGYLYWGQFSAKVARLTSDLRGIDRNSMIDGILTEQTHGFHEGCSIRKRNGVYYLSYAHIGRRSRPTCIAYATSTSPLGPFIYRGVIIDNFGCDRGVWNNHGSIAERDGEWFVFYHRSTHGCTSMRKACAERISFSVDGTIPEVLMTTSGIGAPLDVRLRLDASRACMLSGLVRTVRAGDGREVLSGIRSGDAACYRWLDFASGCTTFSACVAGCGKGGSIEIHLGSADGKIVGSLAVPVRWPSDWDMRSCRIDAVAGIQEIWLVFRGGDDEMFDLRWIRFSM
jgi:arabinoxylan arabinofuranohydrolase